MLTLEEITTGLQDRVLKVVSEKTLLSETTLQKIKAGKKTKIHKRIQKTLSDYLQNNNSEG